MAASSTPLLFPTALAKAAAFGQRPKGWRTKVLVVATDANIPRRRQTHSAGGI